ncbi:HAMP domain-containing histidine kinase [Clostridium sp. DSM 100503]|uniref:sensor histidine kinase n=1 Tax=Clostridium sp. DSM 100503 TaxID=2963282 RepID=UPI002149D118|nr:HAMP domain-containing sensor histidine kinase [Clostridium sp. DSM 100503]MCR1949924.1 HAMP domain-containing histidine kinase [Clostridium sp. DSM 100503]
MKISFKKLSIYMLFSLVVSIFVCVEFIKFTAPIMEKFMMEENINLIKIQVTGIILIFSSITVFIFTFLFLINRKAKYINYISKEVKKIKSEGFGRTIELRGKDELTELCMSINEMSLELKERIENEKKIEKNKNELITNISHDLKTPLTSIIGYLELLNAKKVDEENKDEYVKIAYNKSLRLRTLVNELFEYTKLNSTDIKIQKVKFNISALINQIVGESIIDFSEKDIEVRLENPYKELNSFIDKKLIYRVFENLMKNAQKYSDPNSLFLVIVEENNTNITISFINKCEEIQEDDLDKIFEKFYRIDEARSSENEGAGLGLAIAKKIVELHDGELLVKKLNENIEFKIILNKA